MSEMRGAEAQGYRGYIGVEYEGDKHSEAEGILRTKRALEELKLRLA